MTPMGPPGPQNPYPQNPYPYRPPPQQPYGGAEYEFDAVQNATLSSAALWARILGVMLIVVGAAALFNCNIVSFALNLIMGIFFIGGGSSLAMVVNTQGNDIMHLMQAMTKLGNAFKMRVIITLVGVVLICVVGGLLALLMVLRAAR